MAGNSHTGDVKPTELILNDAGGCIKVCDSSFVKYTAHGPVGATYSWAVTGGTFASTSTGPTVTIHWGTPGAGTLTLTTTGLGGCVSTITMCIDIITRPHALFSLEPKTWPCGCFLWLFWNPSCFSVIYSTADISSPIVSYYLALRRWFCFTVLKIQLVRCAAGTYTVSLIVTNGCRLYLIAFQTIVKIDELAGPDIRNARQ
jgi:hypothetical protein